MDITYKDLKELIEDAVEEGIQNHGPPHCPLQEAGIDHETHKQHHRQIEQIHKDVNKVRSAFLAGVLVTISGGVLGLLWVGFKTKIFGGA